MAAEVDRGGRGWRATIGLGVALCVGCCVAPVLLAAGGGAILVGLAWLEPVGFALLGVWIVGMIWSRHRARRTGCGKDSPAPGSTCVGGSCGCAGGVT